MPPSELVNDPLQGQPTRLEQHEHVIEEVGHFCDDFAISAAGARKRCLEPFLAHLLRDT